MATGFSIDMNGVYDIGGFTAGLGGPAEGGHAAQTDWYNRFGMDLGADPGTTVFAAFDAHITKYNPHRPEADGTEANGRGYGAQLFMRSINDGMGAFYTHISEVPEGLAVGTQISRGDVLGSVFEFVGITPHVHMAIVEIVGALVPANYHGVDSLYTLMQNLTVRDTATVNFNQDGTPPWVS
ncbi:peptidoglycan DD-metalloendopeptidase family protein [Mycobacterium sp. NPDC048908]|uniref:peptidoglycan DD-metalloendopeptidase family protein n=1 Tax=Mycobacterium sp. NPDC048908 TaxID=3364292 RepID=UPI0037130A6F